jgi:hypothetical protein
MCLYMYIYYIYVYICLLLISLLASDALTFRVMGKQRTSLQFKEERKSIKRVLKVFRMSLDVGEGGAF